MTVTVTGCYETVDAVRNTVDDLVCTGIDREKVFADEDNRLIKVMVPDSASNEIREILARHNPADLR